METRVEALLLTDQDRRGPARLVFALFLPPTAGEPKWLPVALAPAGYFVRLRVLADDGSEVWRVGPVKAALKLHPERLESYRQLSPGEVHGVLVDLGEADLAPGTYTAVASYDNRDFIGTAERPVGRLELTARTSFEVAGG